VVILIVDKVVDLAVISGLGLGSGWILLDLDWGLEMALVLLDKRLRQQITEFLPGWVY